MTWRGGRQRQPLTLHWPTVNQLAARASSYTAATHCPAPSCSSEDTVIPARGRGVVKTGLSIAIPHGTYARVAPRSGLAVKNFIDTGAGVVDEDYRGEVGVVLFNHSDADFQGGRGGSKDGGGGWRMAGWRVRSAVKGELACLAQILFCLRWQLAALSMHTICTPAARLAGDSLAAHSCLLGGDSRTVFTCTQ